MKPALLALLLLWGMESNAQTGAAGDVPRFHHLHLNSTNPEAAIDFYTRQFPSTSKTAFAGAPALKAGNVLLLFHKVSQPPLAEPQTAIWHFGWHVTDVRANMARYQSDKSVHLLPLYTTDDGGSVFVSSDTWPGTGGVLGLTKTQIAEAQAKGVKPAGGAGFAYLAGPDSAIIEYQGNLPAERFNHVHMYWHEPFCAQLWYQKHLSATISAAAQRTMKTESTCKVERAADKTWPALEKEGMFRAPAAGVAFSAAPRLSPQIDDVTLNSYIQPTDAPLASTRGHLADHFALSVTDLRAWQKKLQAEGVKFLRKSYKIGGLPAMMIEGPSHEAIELIEIK